MVVADISDEESLNIQKGIGMNSEKNIPLSMSAFSETCVEHVLAISFEIGGCWFFGFSRKVLLNVGKQICYIFYCIVLKTEISLVIKNLHQFGKILSDFW